MRTRVYHWRAYHDHSAPDAAMTSQVGTSLTPFALPPEIHQDFLKICESRSKCKRWKIGPRRDIEKQTIRLSRYAEHLRGGRAPLAGAESSASRFPRKRKREFTCCVCMDSELKVVFIPCRHLCVCEECSGEIDHCPICRAHIVERLNVFVP